MPATQDGPSSTLFTPLPISGNLHLAGAEPERIKTSGMSAQMAAAVEHAPSGSCVGWGIPFKIGDAIVLCDRPVEVEIPAVSARWLVFMHASDLRRQEAGPGGIIPSSHGEGMLGEHAAEYVIRYTDGSESLATIRRRHQVGAFSRHWGENCFEAVAHHKPQPVAQEFEQPQKPGEPYFEYWGLTQTRVITRDEGRWVNWLWAWENPFPEKQICGFRFEPFSGVVVLSAISAGNISSLPLRWEPRKKALLRLPEGMAFKPRLDGEGQLEQIRLDLGQIISARPRQVYPLEGWERSYHNQVAERSEREVLIEYSAHPEACFHIFGPAGEEVLPVQAVEQGRGGMLEAVASAERMVSLRVVEKGSGKTVAVKLHAHGVLGEYLAPLDRHRILNPAWFEDYSPDFLHVQWAENRILTHPTTYINGETRLKMPLGKVYLEVSKGFEIRPVRKVVEIGPDTAEIVVEVEKVLPWREKNWVSADTHVHFLSPVTAMLEGAGEGVNVVNLLASQWGELMTNVGDFDGKNTWGSREAGGDGEYLVRVGTENRQHVLGHISLLGYNGPVIAPMTTGGPDEAAIGDAVETLLSEWAQQCKRQGGVVVLPHFPNPRAEGAAAIVNGDVDAVEMTSWENHYAGIDPYSLSDWYRYLNCGYRIAAVGGTDKMDSATAVGTVRTYAQIQPGELFSYEGWKDAVRRASTFVTYGPLLDLSVDGHPMGSRIAMGSKGGTVDVAWQAASVTVPMTRIELVVNGEIRESRAIDPAQESGHWNVRVEKSCWVAILVRGHYPDQVEMIAAHSSPVMIAVERSELLAAADAVTILDQLEGALVYLDTVGTRAEDRVYKRMRLALEGARRGLHNRMHQEGHYHEHGAPGGHQ